jgi:hypothetical protein
MRGLGVTPARRGLIVAALALPGLLPPEIGRAAPPGGDEACASPRREAARGDSACPRRRRRRARRRARLPELSARAASALFQDEPIPPPEDDEEEGEAKRVVGERGESEVTPGAPSRWSNQGAIEPVPSPVPLQAPLPERNVPRAPGVQTPGQRLRGDEDLLSARLSLSGYRLATNGQDIVYAEEREAGAPVERVPGDRDIELLRGRATLAYERIAGSSFSTHLDLEYRPRLNGDGRFDDQRLNALYVAWGLTDARARGGGPDFGVAVGRVAIREAGYAQADGAAVRWRPLEGLHVGAFGGFTGNPYGYNWALRAPQTFSTDWITGGAFARWRGGQVQASLAGVVTVSNVPRPPPDPGSTDRIYVHADVAWQPERDLSVFATGFVDLLPSGQLVQNAELAGAWTPGRWNLGLALGRFSTLSYALSNGYTYRIDPARNVFDDSPTGNAPIVDADGNAIVPFDAARLTAVYNQVRLSAGYRVLPRLETFVRVNTLIRDVSLAEEANAEALAGEVPLAEVDFAPLRLLPAVGARFRDPGVHRRRRRSVASRRHRAGRYRAVALRPPSPRGRPLPLWRHRGARWRGVTRLRLPPSVVSRSSPAAARAPLLPGGRGPRAACLTRPDDRSAPRGRGARDHPRAGELSRVRGGRVAALTAPAPGQGESHLRRATSTRHPASSAVTRPASPPWR